MTAAAPALGRSRWEAVAWIYMRASGIALLVLVLGHMFLMHVLVGVDRIDFGFVAAQWNGLGWRAYDFSMLILAMLHGTNGVRSLAYDHIPRRARRAFLSAAYAACATVTALGSWIVLTFPNPV